jgi:hypothetical protein
MRPGAFCDVGEILVEVVAVLPENVYSRGRPDERLHLFFFPDCWALRNCVASAFMPVQNASVSGIRSEARPSSSSVRRRASSSLACASRSKLRKYSLTLP